MRLRLLAALLLLPAYPPRSQAHPPAASGLALDSAPPLTALATCREALAHYDSIGSTRRGLDPLAQGELHRALQAGFRLGHYREAALYYHRLGSPSWEGGARSRQGGVHFDAGRADSAQAAFADALALTRQAGDSVSQAGIHRWLSLLARRRGARDTAITHAQASLALYAGLGRPTGMRRAERDLGELFALTRQPDSAIAYLERSLAPGAAVGDSATEAQALRLLADLYVESSVADSLIWARRGELALRAAGTGDPDSAVAAFAARARAATDSAGISSAYAWIGMVEHGRRRLGPAILAYRAAILFHPAGGSRRSLGVLHSVQGTLWERQGRLDSMTAQYRLSSGTGVATVPSPPLRLLDRASRLQAAGQPDSALAAYHEAARGFAAMGSVGLRNIALLRVVMLHRERGRLDSALAQGRWLQAEWRRLGVPGEEALLWMTLGSIYFEQAEFEAAIAAGDSGLRIAPPDAEPRLLATLHGTRGTGFALTGRYDSALVHHYASVRHWARAGDLYRAEAARATGHLGAVFRQMGQFDSALAYHRTQRGMAPEGTAGELIALRELAYDFEGLGSRDSALAYHELRRAAAQWRRANTSSDPTGDALAESESLDRIGLLRWEAGDAAGADTSFRAALESYRRGGKEWTTPSTLSDIATLFDRIGAADSALAWHRRALALAVETGRTTDRVRSLAAVGRLEARRGDHAAGLAALREAAAIQRSRGAIETGASVLGSLAYTLRRLPEPDLPGALAALDTAAALRAQVRARAGGDEYRLGVQDIATLPAGEWELAWLQYGAATDPERAAYGALAAAERGRAQALLDLMRGTSHTARAGADLVAEGRRLLRAATASGAGVLSYLVTDDTLLIWYARPIAGRVRLTLHPVAVPADTLARLAARWRAALGVDQVELGSRLAGDDGAGVEDVLRIGVAGAASAGTGDATAIGRALAALVLPEELRNAGAGRGELVLVPHGVLSVIPFGALPVGDSTTLGLVRALRYAPSIASLVEVERRPVLGAGPRAARLRQALVVGDPRMPSIARLSARRSTVAPLLRGFPPPGRRGRRWLMPVPCPATLARAWRQRWMARRAIYLLSYGYAHAAGKYCAVSFVASPRSARRGSLRG